MMFFLGNSKELLYNYKKLYMGGFKDGKKTIT